MSADCTLGVLETGSETFHTTISLEFVIAILESRNGYTLSLAFSS